MICRGEEVEMRVGIHSGKVMCGFVGNTRYKYDVLSADVFKANDMESCGRLRDQSVFNQSTTTTDEVEITIIYDEEDYNYYCDLLKLYIILKNCSIGVITFFFIIKSFFISTSSVLPHTTPNFNIYNETIVVVFQ